MCSRPSLWPLCLSAFFQAGWLSIENGKKMKNNKILTLAFLRSFYLQATWNFERMQNVGFLYILLPFFQFIYPDKEKRKAVLLRHLGFFNTHPYAASVILGIVASVEAERAEQDTIGEGEIMVLKTNMAGPLAAIGDAFFWATWRPFVVALSLFIVVFFVEDPGFRGTWFAPLFFLVVFNALHLPFRYWGLKVSYTARTRVVKIIAGMEFQKIIDFIRYMGMVIVTLSFVFYLLFSLHSTAEYSVVIIVFLATIAGGAVLKSPTALSYILTAIGVVLAYMKIDFIKFM